MSLQSMLEESFPAWMWQVQGARDRASAFGTRSGFEPLRFDVRADLGGGLTVWLDVKDSRFQATRPDVRACVADILADVVSTEAAMKLHKDALRSLRRKADRVNVAEVRDAVEGRR